MSQQDAKTRYGYQDDAVEAIVGDFKDEPTGRFLLVVPTGGGKTRIAARSVLRLLSEGIEPPGRVMWMAHRTELLSQARATFEELANGTPLRDLLPRVDFKMLAEVGGYLRSTEEVRLIVIDEAHHGEANSYQSIFQQSRAGVLGLTATPSRTDRRPLSFQRESYSIGFPELVACGALLRPEVITIEGGEYELADLSSREALDVLDNADRNARIIDAVRKHKDVAKKVVIYVGTVKHAQSLYRQFIESDVAASYEQVSYIVGQERRRFVVTTRREVAPERAEFFEIERGLARSIVINVDVLTEGYDDPSINTVVMARPTQSKLVYMQAAGRAIRRSRDGSAKQAFIIEVADRLPNVRYRIDNRWLFSDVSDLLEPAVVDYWYDSEDALRAAFADMFATYRVKESDRQVPNVGASLDRFTALLFKVYAGEDEYYHLPLIVSNATRRAASDLFNILSLQMSRYFGNAPEQVFNFVRAHATAFPLLESQRARQFVLQAMENAWVVASQGSDASRQRFLELSPWVTFVSFRYRRSVQALPDDLMQFTEDMTNRESVRSMLLTRSYTVGHYLVKLPLPVAGTVGEVLDASEFSAVQGAVERLHAAKTHDDPVEQWKAVTIGLGSVRLPLEARFQQSLVTIARESLDFHRQLDN